MGKGCDELADAMAQDAMAEGDFRQALEVLVASYQHRIVRYCTNMLGGFGADAADVAQEVFLSAYEAMPRFRGQASVCTWLYGIAHKRCLKTLRDRSRRARIETQRQESIAAEVYPGAPAPPGSDLEEEHRRMEEKVRRGLKRLSRLEASVLLAHYTDGHSLANIASIHRISLATVHRLRRRALERLQQEIDHEAS
ncbi:MAG: RNA polymerase sigma factor [Candidatus Methylomirabilia bacterium]